jgi:hypothetical protein
MDKLLKLIMKIQQDISLSFSVSLSGNWIHGNGDGDKYPLKLKETYGFLAFSSPPKSDVLSLLKLLLEKEIDEYTEYFSLENHLVPFILGETSRISAPEDTQRKLSKGKLFLIESKQLEENKILLEEAYENEIHYLWSLEGRLLLFLQDSKEEEISQSIYASILENTMEEPSVAYISHHVDFDDLPKAYAELKQIMLTGKTYYKEKLIFRNTDLLLESFIYSIPKEEKNHMIVPYQQLLTSLDKEDKAMIYSYVNNHMALQKTAKELHLHRNTLTYRLGKLEKDFNLDLKNMTHVIYLYTMILFLNEL